MKEWETRFNWVEEPCVSPDGERIASIVNVDEMVFDICENGQVWGGEHEKAWSLRAFPGKGFAVCVCQDEEWSLVVNAKAWDNWFDFIWNLQVSPDGSGLGVAVQKDMEYGMAVNDRVWENRFENITGMVLGRAGASAAVVQVASMAAADISAFEAGLYSVALDGRAFEGRYLNIWDISFDPGSESLAWSARLTREAYTIVHNDIPWENRFQAAWKPEFTHRGASVVAPVRQGGKWNLFKDDKPFWKGGYDQLWHLAVSPVQDRVAAVAAGPYGRWTGVEDDRPWPVFFDTMIRDITYSRDGSALVAVVKDQGTWTLARNGEVWNLKADKIFTPAISPDGSVVAVTIEKDGQAFVAANNRIIAGPYTFFADPVISPDNTKLLVKGIENGIYKRSIIPLTR